MPSPQRLDSQRVGDLQGLLLRQPTPDQRAIAGYGCVTLLIMHELGYMELDNRGAELPFQVLHRPRLCAAIVNRLTSHSTIIETGTESHRLAHTRQHSG